VTCQNVDLLIDRLKSGPSGKQVKSHFRSKIVQLKVIGKTLQLFMSSLKYSQSDYSR